MARRPRRRLGTTPAGAPSHQRRSASVPGPNRRSHALDELGPRLACSAARRGRPAGARSTAGGWSTSPLRRCPATFPSAHRTVSSCERRRPRSATWCRGRARRRPSAGGGGQLVRSARPRRARRGGHPAPQPPRRVDGDPRRPSPQARPPPAAATRAAGPASIAPTTGSVAAHWVRRIPICRCRRRPRRAPGWCRRGWHRRPRAAIDRWIVGVSVAWSATTPSATGPGPSNRAWGTSPWRCASRARRWSSLMCGRVVTCASRRVRPIAPAPSARYPPPLSRRSRAPRPAGPG